MIKGCGNCKKDDCWFRMGRRCAGFVAADVAESAPSTLTDTGSPKLPLFSEWKYAIEKDMGYLLGRNDLSILKLGYIILERHRIAQTNDIDVAVNAATKPEETIMKQLKAEIHTLLNNSRTMSTVEFYSYIGDNHEQLNELSK